MKNCRCHRVEVISGFCLGVREGREKKEVVTSELQMPKGRRRLFVFGAIEGRAEMVGNVSGFTIKGTMEPGLTF